RAPRVSPTPTSQNGLKPSSCGFHSDPRARFGKLLHLWLQERCEFRSKTVLPEVRHLERWARWSGSLLRKRLAIHDEPNAPLFSGVRVDHIGVAFQFVCSYVLRGRTLEA